MPSTKRKRHTPAILDVRFGCDFMDGAAVSVWVRPSSRGFGLEVELPAQDESLLPPIEVGIEEWLETSIPVDGGPYVDSGRFELVGRKDIAVDTEDGGTAVVVVLRFLARPHNYTTTR